MTLDFVLRISRKIRASELRTNDCDSDTKGDKVEEETSEMFGLYDCEGKKEAY